jgi:hypothetical protein
MQFSHSGDTVQIVRITGPAHNLLRLQLGTAPGVIETRNLDESGPAVLRTDEVEHEVLGGVAEANTLFGTSVGVRVIHYAASDTPPVSVYRDLARALVEHFAVELA